MRGVGDSLKTLTHTLFSPQAPLSQVLVILSHCERAQAFQELICILDLELNDFLATNNQHSLVTLGDLSPRRLGVALELPSNCGEPWEVCEGVIHLRKEKNQVEETQT